MEVKDELDDEDNTTKGLPNDTEIVFQESDLHVQIKCEDRV